MFTKLFLSLSFKSFNLYSLLIILLFFFKFSHFIKFLLKSSSMFTLYKLTTISSLLFFLKIKKSLLFNISFFIFGSIEFISIISCSFIKKLILLKFNFEITFSKSFNSSIVNILSNFLLLISKLIYLILKLYNKSILFFVIFKLSIFEFNMLSIIVFLI